MMRDRFGRIYVGDVILSVNGREVNTKDDIYHELGKYKIGDRVEIKYLRDEKIRVVKVKLRAL